MQRKSPLGAPKAKVAKAKVAKAKVAKLKVAKLKVAKLKVAKLKVAKVAKPKVAKPKKASKSKPVHGIKSRPEDAKVQSAHRRGGGRSRRRRRRLSRHPEAVRSRRRRAQQRAIRDQLTFEREEREERRRRRARERRAGAPDERLLAVDWLWRVRDDVAKVFPCSLSMTEGVRSDAGDEDGDADGAVRQRENMRATWLVVGKLTPVTPVSYLELAHALARVRDDFLLEAAVNPQRVSQVRVSYEDPRGRRGEGDTIVSKLGAWEFVVSELVFELVGGGGADGFDPDSLAARYAETRVTAFYVYFGGQILRWSTSWRSPLLSVPIGGQDRGGS